MSEPRLRQDHHVVLIGDQIAETNRGYTKALGKGSCDHNILILANQVDATITTKHVIGLVNHKETILLQCLSCKLVKLFLGKSAFYRLIGIGQEKHSWLIYKAPLEISMIKLKLGRVLYFMNMHLKELGIHFIHGISW